MTYWKVKFGFGASERVSIGEKDLEKAIWAQIAKKPVMLGEAYINGSNIISITPNYHAYTGWNEWYEPKDSEDLKQIERDCPNFAGVLEKYQHRVRFLIENGRQEEIGKGVEIPQLGKAVTKDVERGGEVKKIGDIIKKESS